MSIDHSNARYQLILADTEAIKSACSADKNCPFRDFTLTDYTLKFEYCKDTTKIFYWFNLCKDYPEHSVLTISKNSANAKHETRFLDDRLPVAFRKIAAEIYQDMHIPLGVVKSQSNTSCSSSTSQPAQLWHKLNSDEEFSSGYDDDDDEDNIIDDCTENPTGTLCARLSADIDAVKRKFGSAALELRIHEAIDECDVDLMLKSSGLDRDVAEAWKLIPDLPIHIQFTLSMSNYFNCAVHKKKVLVFQIDQGGQKVKKGACFQIEKIVESFVNENWKNTSVQISKLRFSPHGADGQPAESNVAPNKLRIVDDSDAKLSKLIEMGYSSEQASQALTACNGDISDAVNLLLISSNEDGPISTPPASKSSSSTSAAAAAAPSKSVTATSKGKVTAAKKLFVRDPFVPPPASAVKKVPSDKDGFLVQVLNYAQQRLSSLNEFCVICDQPHIGESNSMLKPTVCCRELCVFAFETLGVMSNAADDIATAAEVIDLLIAMARAASESSRRNDILEPYPTVVQPGNSNTLGLDPKNKDFDKLKAALAGIPPMEALMKHMGPELKKELDKRNILAYPLLQWIISSNRSHIVRISKKNQLDFMKTNHQFLMRSSPPAKEAIFVEARKKYGSTFAFHGSGIENWHSIVRRGLINASNTKLQLNGAAHGSGIYLSPSAALSFGYSNRSHCVYASLQPSKTQSATNLNSSDRFLKSKNIICIALCEVITSPELRKTGDIWVMPVEDYVCTRFFFVFEDYCHDSGNTDTRTFGMLEKIQKAAAQLY